MKLKVKLQKFNQKKKPNTVIFNYKEINEKRKKRGKPVVGIDPACASES